MVSLLPILSDDHLPTACLLQASTLHHKIDTQMAMEEDTTADERMDTDQDLASLRLARLVCSRSLTCHDHILLNMATNSHRIQWQPV